jgi:flagellar protein FliL
MAEESGKSSAANAAAGAATVQPKSHVPLMITIALLAIAGGGGSAWFVLQRGRTAEAAHAEPTGPPKYLVHLEGFTVNLADGEEAHFLRVTMDLGIDRLPDGVSEKDKAAASLPVARIRDAILSVLTAGKADNLLTSDGKAQLKKNLVDSLNRNVPELGVREVYFTEFLVQR